jgi:hypothetical protein
MSRHVGFWGLLVAVVAVTGCGGAPEDVAASKIDPPVAVDDAAAETSSDAPSTADGGKVNEGDSQSPPPDSEADSDAGQDADPPSNDDGGHVVDAGDQDSSPAVDAGNPVVDAGQDSALPAVDAGQDSGSPKVDSGNPVVDSGSEPDANDSGSPVVDSGPPPVCTSGDKDCSGLTPRSCVGGQWVKGSACSFVCSAGSCEGSCAPGSMKCSGTESQLCDGTGTWQNNTACPFVCTGAGVCSGNCVPGSSPVCSGNNVESCDNGTLTVSQSCPFVCSAGACEGSCDPGAMTCNGLTPQTCNGSGSWVSGAACSYLCTGAGVCSGECTPGAVTCSGNGTETCGSNAMWGSVSSCPAPSNASPSCSGAGSCAWACNASYTNCSGSCLDLTSDPNNCGACGHSCGGGTCSNSVCGTETLVTVSGPVTGTVSTLAVGGGSIYWTGSTNGVMGMNLTTNVQTPIASATNAKYLQVDANNAYWSTSGAVSKAPLSGAGPTTLVIGVSPGQWPVFTIDSTDTYLYTWGDRYLYKITIATGFATTVTFSSTVIPTAITTDGTNVYVADSTSKEIMKVSVNGGALSKVVSTSVLSIYFALDGETLFYTTNGTGISEVALPSGSPTVVDSTGYDGFLTTDGTSLFYATGYLAKQVIGSSTVTKLASSVLGAIQDVVLDSTYVYFTEPALTGGGDTSIMRIVKN